MTTMEIPVWFYVTTLLGSLGAGYGIGLKVATKSVVIDDRTVCLTPAEYGNRKNGVYIKKVYTNGKCSDISCMYLEESQICSITSKRCKYLT